MVGKACDMNVDGILPRASRIVLAITPFVTALITFAINFGTASWESVAITRKK